MAKLKAYGRTEVVRMSFENLNPVSDLITYEKVTVAMMSDGKLLTKRDVIFKPTMYGNSSGDKHTWGWKVKGRLKENITKDRFVEIYSKRGFKIV